LDSSAASSNIQELRSCPPHWQYVVTGHTTTLGVIQSFKNYNPGPGNRTDTFTSSTSGTISITFTAGVSVDVSAIFTGAQASTSIALQLSTTAGFTNSVAVVVPPKKWVRASWGVWQYSSTGYESYVQGNCSTTNQQPMWAKVPETTTGWTTSISST
jgi:hypothetical protein